MTIKRYLKRAVDSTLRRFGVQLIRPAQDFDSRPTGHALGRMLGELADAFDAWSATTRIWPLTPQFDTRVVVARFYDAYLASAFRGQGGGSRFNNLLWLHLLARATGPSVVIDSGTYRGASAWAFATALPRCPVISFDLDLGPLQLRLPGVTYLEQDWTRYDFRGLDLSRALVYFDDHVDQGMRLRQAAERGIEQLVFDDDFPVTSFFAMAHDGSALPKIEFLLDPLLAEVRELTWFSRGRELHWPIDHDRIARLRSTIAATERLPNTSLITGVHQTPYRLVRTVGTDRGRGTSALVEGT